MWWCSNKNYTVCLVYFICETFDAFQINVPSNGLIQSWCMMFFKLHVFSNILMLYWCKSNVLMKKVIFHKYWIYSIWFLISETPIFYNPLCLWLGKTEQTHDLKVYEVKTIEYFCLVIKHSFWFLEEKRIWYNQVNSCMIFAVNIKRDIVNVNMD